MCLEIIHRKVAGEDAYDMEDGKSNRIPLNLI
jgi:hypothetical protein